MAVADFSATVMPLIFDQASEFVIPFKFVDDAGVIVPMVTLGYAARAALRGGDANEVLLSLTTVNAGIVLSDTDPNLQIFFSAVSTAALIARVGGWDLFLDPDGVSDALSFRVVYGSWMMNPYFTNP